MMKLTAIGAFAALTSLFDAREGFAQARLLPEVVAGSRVRFVRNGESSRVEGVVVERTELEMLVRQRLSNATTLAVLDSLQELALGKQRPIGAAAAHGAFVGFRVGATVTAGATVLVWLSDADERCNDCFISATGATLILGVLATGALTLAGGLIGASAPGYDWQLLVRPSRVAADRRTLQLGVRLAVQ